MATKYPAPLSAKAQDAKWAAEDDLRTLVRAGEIRRDKKRLAAATKCAKEQAKALETAQA